MVRRRAALLLELSLWLFVVMGLLMAGRAATEAALVAIRVEEEEVVAVMVIVLVDVS